MNNSIAYWVGRAESAAFEIEVNSQRIGEGYLWAQDSLDKAMATHKEAMENLMRIADHSYYVSTHQPETPIDHFHFGTTDE